MMSEAQLCPSPAILRHNVLCDGPWTDEAQAHKTKQDYEANDEHPAAHPLCWLLGMRRERPRDYRAVERAEKFAPLHLCNPRAFVTARP